eukprot:TRINITY_DN29584_c0_g1_i1.p2 TRINITY_DN29584_c0_g1~~TRINITY_DN29584_c0_g1_i1.p2  ORF type:complete len:163 (+),score=13.70 TRINITY_DN29584_c0_g1_i1:329-817(+)
MGCGIFKPAPAPVMPKIHPPDVEVPEHLRLGISSYGVEQALERIGFRYDFFKEEGVWSMTDQDCAFENTYERPESMQWLTELVGPFKIIPDSAISRATTTGTGYDVAACVRQFLKNTDNEAISMCEVMQGEGSHEVGRADVFFSHVQQLHVARALHSLLWPF